MKKLTQPDLDPTLKSCGYGLRIPREKFSDSDWACISGFIQSILPRKSIVRYAQDIWVFELLDDGSIAEMSRDTRLRNRYDLPNRYLFSEAYDQIFEGFAALNIDPAPPARHIVDTQSWHVAEELDKNLAAARRTWKGLARTVLSAVRLCNAFPDVVYPPVVTEEEQFRRLQEWVNARVDDGKLLDAVRAQLKDNKKLE